MSAQSKLASIVDGLSVIKAEAKKPPEQIEREEAERKKDAYVQELRSFPDEEKKARAYELRMQGMTVEVISRMFSVTPTTIRKWLQDYAKIYVETIETNPAANIIAESLLFYEKLESLCLLEIKQLPDHKFQKDRDGNHVEVIDYEAKGLKQRYVESALKVREKSLALMQSTGIIPKESDRLYRTMDKEKPIDTDAQLDSKPEKSKDELAAQVLRLLSKGRHIV